jgi:hypothetical protein
MATRAYEKQRTALLPSIRTTTSSPRAASSGLIRRHTRGRPGDLDRLRKLVDLTVLMATTARFAEHASVADGVSDLFVKIFESEASHVRLVHGVQSLPVGAPLVVDTIFEIAP